MQCFLGVVKVMIFYQTPPLGDRVIWSIQWMFYSNKALYG
jgi:hypothetical protein